MLAPALSPPHHPPTPSTAAHSSSPLPVWYRSHYRCAQDASLTCNPVAVLSSQSEAVTFTDARPAYEQTTIHQPTTRVRATPFTYYTFTARLSVRHRSIRAASGNSRRVQLPPR